MSLDTRISVALDGQVYKRIVAFSLEEKVGDHAVLKVSLRGRDLEHSLDGSSVMESSRSYLGKVFSVQIEPSKKVGYNTLYFKGLITQVKGTKGKEKDGLGDVIHIVGKSASIVLSDRPHTQSFLEESLSEIVNKSTRNYESYGLQIQINPERDQQLLYSVQQGQNTFEYLQYLAASYGEYLFYSKDTLYFGNPNLDNEVELRYGYDLKDFTLGMDTTPLRFDYHTHDYNNEQSVNVNSSSANTGATGYSAFASQQSGAIYGNPSTQAFASFESTEAQRRIDEAIVLQKKVLEQSQVMLEGESVNTSISLGVVIKIKNMNGEYFGTYRITEVTHGYSQRGNYINKFKAIPTEIDIYPLTNIDTKVMGYPEVATVVETSDPSGMSRIKVQFPWQKQSNETTPWIRVATPYAGGDRGFHFIPEVGDSVLVGFDAANAERPFVQSALYTGQNKHSGWQGQNNDFKGITTKGGHTIEFKDTKDGEMLTITDKNSNMIQLDTSNSSIVISAPENLVFQAKNIDVRAKEHIRVTAGKNKMVQVGGNYMLEASNIYESASEDIQSKASEIANQAAADLHITSSGGNVNKNANGKMNNNSAQQSNLF